MLTNYSIQYTILLMREKLLFLCSFVIIFAFWVYKQQDFVCTNIKEFYLLFTKKPTISFLLPTYNRGKFLTRTIDSIFAQTYDDWELIIINDGSIDMTKEILRKYRTNPKVRVFANHKNQGIIYSLNRGFKKVRGKYIARHDDDDISAPDRLERTLYLMEKENLDMVGAWCREGKYWYNTKAKDYFNSLGIGLYVMTDNIYCQSASLMRKSFLDKHNIRYNTEYLNAEDFDYTMQMFLNGAKFGYVGGDSLAEYTRSPHSSFWFDAQYNSAEKIRIKVLSRIIPDFDEKMANEPITKLMPYIIEGNKTTKIFNQEELENCQKTQCYKWNQTLRQKL